MQVKPHKAAFISHDIVAKGSNAEEIPVFISVMHLHINCGSEWARRHNSLVTALDASDDKVNVCWPLQCNNWLSYETKGKSALCFFLYFRLLTWRVTLMFTATRLRKVTENRNRMLFWSRKVLWGHGKFAMLSRFPHACVECRARGNFSSHFQEVCHRREHHFVEKPTCCSSEARQPWFWTGQRWKGPRRTCQCFG